MSESLESNLLTEEIASLQKQIAELELHNAETEEALDAIRSGTVDALVIYSGEEDKIYTLHSAETPYRVLIESINEGAATLIADGTILYCNRQFAEMLNAPLETIIGTSIYKYIQPERKELFSSLIQRGLTENCREEIELIREEGPSIPVMFSLNNFSGAGYPGLCLIATDLTERKIAKEMTAMVQLKIRAEEDLRRAHRELEKANKELKEEIAERKQTEEALQAMQQTLQTMIDHMPAAVALIRGNDLRLQLVNPSYQAIAPGKRMVGYTLDEIWPETGQNFTNLCRQVLETGIPHEVVDEMSLIRRDYDGPLETGYFSWSLHRVRLPGNLGWGLLNASWETTARKQAEEALNESRKKYQDLIETTGEFIWEVDSQGRYTYCSPQMETLWGLKPKEMIGKTPFDQMPPGVKEEAEAGFREIIKVAAPFRGVTTQSYNANGEIIYVEISGNPFFNKNGAFQGYRGITRDITEREQVEEKLRQAYDELDQRVRERTHDLLVVNEELKAEVADREKAEREARSNAQLAEGLAESVIALTSSLKLEDVLEILLDQIRRVIPYQGANILLLEGNKLNVACNRGFEDFPDSLVVMKQAISIEEFPLFQQIRDTRHSLLVNNTLEEPRWRMTEGMEWIRSHMCTPLIANGKVVGFINLNSERFDAYNEENLSRLTAFSGHASLAIQNAQLYAAESRARRAAEVMSAMSLALSQTLNLDMVLQAMLQYLPKLISYEGAYIVTLEEESRIKIRVINGFHNDLYPKRGAGSFFYSWEVPYIQEVLTRKKSLLIKDTQEYPNWDTLITNKEIRTWLGIPIIIRGEVRGIVGLVDSKPGAVTEEHQRFMESITAQMSVAIQNAWLFEQVRVGQERFQLLSRRLVEVQETERRAIVRELHDETSQALTALKFGIGYIDHEIDHPEKLHERIIEVKQLADEVLESLHRIAVNLRPASLDHVGLLPALEQLTKDFGARYHLNVHFKADVLSDNGRLANETETALYRIVQEALTNIARHANANNVDVILQRENKKLLIIIEDDGVGFETGKIREKDKLGLIGMQERAQMMGGSMQIESTPGGGTTIVVEVNYDDPNFNHR